VTRRALAIAVGAALLATLAGVAWRAGTSAHDAEHATEHAVESADARTGPGTDASPSADAVADRALDPVTAGSLRGTEVDGEVRFAADGTPIPDAGLRRLFDYHLALMGETDLSGIRALLARHVTARHGALRADRVMAVFERYVAYQTALSQSSLDRERDPARRLDGMMRLRREILGETMASGFFGEEEALARLGLERRRIAADATMSEASRQEALAALDREAGYGGRTASDLPALAADQARDLAQRGLSPAQRDAERRVLWGEEAARRLAALDAEQADWDARVRRYADARARIDRDPRLDADARARAIVALRARSFSPREQRRIASLEAIGRLDAALSQ
jgi:lipase chaperone LimK